MSKHYCIRCSECNIVIEQCRCPSLTKTVTYRVCNNCKNADELMVEELNDAFDIIEQHS